MFTKTTTPILKDNDGSSRAQAQDWQLAVIGTKVEYRFFGILLYKKVLYSPAKYGLVNYEFFTSI